MADNAFVKIGTALLKHQVKKLVGEETLGVISEELADIGGDKLDAWLGDKSAIEGLEKAAKTAEECFQDSIEDHELKQWMISLPIGDLPKVTEAIEKLPTSPNEKELEESIRDAVAGWRKLSPEQTEKAVNSFLSCLRSALLPIEKQQLMIIGREVLKTGEKVDLLIRWFEQYIITGKPVEVKQLNSEPNEGWYLAHPYPMPPNFTGRVEERKMLADWLNKDNENRLFILRALGGFGKSALTWHWLTHDVDPKEWTKVIFWSFYEGDASFEHFIEETLKYLKLEVPQGQRPQVDELLKAMQRQKILLIMDGFERALRAYSSMNAAYQGDEAEESPSPASGRGDRGEGLDCVNLNAEIFLKSICSLPNIKSKVLMTTRLTPRAVKPRGEFMLGCREVELTSMQPADAVEFFHKQKIKGTHTEIEAACAPYGYHPLSLRLLAGRILKDFENPADIVVAQKLKIDGDIVQQKHHVLEVSYNSLPPHEQKLLSTIACFRSPVEFKTLESIAGDVVGTQYIVSLQDDLHDLVARGLLHFDEKNKKFDLHPIVRHYAYERLTTSDRTTTHTCLRDYFAAIDVPEQTQTINDLAPVVELYHHTLQAGEVGKAIKLFFDRLRDPLYFQLGAYQTIIELLIPLFPTGENEPPQIINENYRSTILNILAASFGMIGQPHHAKDVYETAINILKENMEKKGDLAVNLTGISQIGYAPIGALKIAETNLRKSITIFQEFENTMYYQAAARAELGVLLCYLGIWNEAKQEFDKSIKMLLELEEFQYASVVKSYQVLRIVLMIVYNFAKPSNEYHELAIEYAQQIFELLEEREKKYGRKNPRDFVLAYWSLGAAYRVNNDLPKAEENLSKAVNICRQINMSMNEANILLDFARLRYDQTNYEEAKSLAEEALLITERCGYVLQGADVNLFLAKYALEQEKDKAKAKAYADEALKLATCDGPPYYYKVAYEEAERMLEKLG